MKLAGEDAVRKLYGEAGFRHTVLRPGGLMDGAPFMHELKFDKGDRITGSIARGNVAESAVISLWHPKAMNQTFELIKTGDEEVPQTSLEPFFEQL
jgi:hypothetical protein